MLYERENENDAFYKITKIAQEPHVEKSKGKIPKQKQAKKWSKYEGIRGARRKQPLWYMIKALT